MMMWNKIKIVAALVCVVALVGTGTGWLARGRNAVETPLPAAEPLTKKETPPKAAPDPVEKIKDQITTTEIRLAQLAEKENKWEEGMVEKLIDAQLQLAEAREEVSIQLRTKTVRQLRDVHKRMYRMEYELECLQTRRARTREEYAVKRQALLARLEQLERQSEGLEPADRLRDVERKLDALRREVGELRHSLERQGKDAHKKSE